MGAIAAVLGRTVPAAADDVTRALRAAPHRGDHRYVVTHGDAVLGIAHAKSPTDSIGLARVGPFTAAITGRLDESAGVTRFASEEASAIPHSPSDARGAAAAVAAGWAKHGRDLPGLMRGSYLAVVTDGRQLWAWRDHLGFSPAFFCADGKRVVVATEAKQVVAAAGLAREPDLDVVAQIVFGEYDDDTPSALAGVQRLAKSTLFTAHGDTVGHQRYWRPEDLLETATLRADGLQEPFDALMTRAVGRVLTPHAAVSLSGGIDSPAVAAYGAGVQLERTGRPLASLTALYPDFPDVDEGPWVELIAGKLGLELQTYPQQARAMDSLDEWTRLFDGPVPTIWIDDLAEGYREAARRGFDTLLTGELAEFVIDLRGGLVAHLIRTGRLSAAAAKLSAQRRRGVGLAPLARQVLVAGVPARTQARLARRIGRGRTLRVPNWVDATRVFQAAADDVAAGGQGWTALQLSAFTGPGLSIEADDVVQAVTGVTARRPWADVDLWEFFLSLPAEVKFPDSRSKGLVRQLLRGRVPTEVLDRTDQTVFTSAALGRIDFVALHRWLVDPPHRLPGIDYVRLAEALQRRELDMPSYVWARDLACAHAFLEQW